MTAPLTTPVIALTVALGVPARGAALAGAMVAVTLSALLPP